MEKVSWREMSDKVCIKCGKPLKKNLVMKKPGATLCYKCWKKAHP